MRKTNSEVEVSGGVHVAAGPGHINPIEDTTGKSHLTRNFRPDESARLIQSATGGSLINPDDKSPIREMTSFGETSIW